MDAVFLGTPDFAGLVLRDLAARHRILAVVTQPDKRAGRGRRPTPPPVKEVSRDLDLPCLQPADARGADLPSRLAATGAEVGLVVAYGGYLPASLLAALPRGFINLHPSLLPRYRGAAPVNWAIIKGEEITGLTVIRMTGKMDAGPILGQRAMEILPDESAGELLTRMAAPGALLLDSVLDDLAAGSAFNVPQDDTLATQAPRLRKEDGLIDWSRPAREIHNLVRGVNPWPGAITYHGGDAVKVWRTSPLEAMGGRPGEIVAADPGRGLVVAAGTGSLSLERLQREGGQVLPAGDFLRGARWRAGRILTSAPGRA